MITNYETTRNKDMLLQAAYEENKNLDMVAKVDNFITEDFETNNAYIFISKDVKNYYSFLKVVDSIILNKRRNYQIDIASFAKVNFLDVQDVFRAFISRLAFHDAKLYSAKGNVDKKNKEDDIKISLFYNDKSYSDLVKKLVIIADAVNGARDLQITPPNIATSEYIATKVKNVFTKNTKVNVKILKKSEISKLGMNLLLAVNAGSSYDPYVLVAEYRGNPQSKEKYVFVGKGITFDTGGYNTKGYHMEGMKFDMSGAAICAYAVKAIADLNIKANVCAVMMLTDNAIDAKPTMPESVIKSMSGKTVEITDTDAEGRLVLADGLYYGAKKLGATLLVDVATLTGTIVSALGKTFSGIYATSNERWEEIEKAANIAHEKVWRLPMHESFNKPNKASKVADLNNYNNSEKSDCNTAAMFLKEFTDNIDFIHCDVAGTADAAGMGLGVLVSTLTELAEGQK